MCRSRSSLAALLVAALALMPYPSRAQQSTANAVNLSDKVLDLVFHVEDMGSEAEAMGANVKPMAVKESRSVVRIDLASDVLFDFDSAELKPKARKTLAAAAQIIRTRAHGPVHIFGYTDSKGSVQYNAALSQRRAQSVEHWFVTSGGLQSVAFLTEGRGASDPVASNTKPNGSDNPSGRAKNRRVEIVIAK
jgi:outer membrane protein OmpA-like peptidoglycan-associated protein